MKVGDLVRDTCDGELGIITSERQSRGQLNADFIEVLWMSYSKPMPVDLSIVEKKWVVLSEGEK